VVQVVRVLVSAAGLAVVLFVAGSAIKTVVVPRAVSSSITRALFIVVRRFFDLLLRGRDDWRSRDRVLAYYAPISLLLLPGVWVALVILGYSLMYWAVGTGTWADAFTESGSSMLTLGFVPPSGPGEVVLAFTEATLGLGIVALLISYLPSIYAAFGRREQLVGQLEVRAGTPPSASVLLARYQVIGMLRNIDVELYTKWEAWFVDVEESHTSLPALVFFRSPQPTRSWITAAGCILDTASISHSTLAGQSSAHAALMIRTGFLCLRRIADYFGILYEPDVNQETPISVTRREFDLLCVELEAAGIELRADREQAWRDFVGWRANYDTVLLAIAGLVAAPPGRWISDEGAPRFRPRIFRRTAGR
jgi:hypothetical protein